MKTHWPTRWHPCASDQAWLAWALTFIAQAEREALDARGEFHIVLAGGNTPRLVYQALAREEHDWSRWRVWLGDERCLPLDHPERNSVMASTTLPAQIGAWHLIAAELGAQAGAAAYTAELSHLGEFDLVLLGLGEDGHTASLFPGHTSEDAADALAVFDAPKPPSERISLSAKRLSRARHVLFLVSGAGKQDALLRWRGDAAISAAISATIPAASIQPEAGVDVLLGPELTLPGVSP